MEPESVPQPRIFQGILLGSRRRQGRLLLLRILHGQEEATSLPSLAAAPETATKAAVCSLEDAQCRRDGVHVCDVPCLQDYRAHAMVVLRFLIVTGTGCVAIGMSVVSEAERKRSCATCLALFDAHE